MEMWIYADFQNLDDENRVRLNCRGTQDDMARLGFQFVDGQEVTLYTDDADEAGKPDDLLVDGVVRHSDVEGIWVADVDWRSLRHVSDEKRPGDGNGAPGQKASREAI
jgi:hypothetical protein